MIGVDLVIAVPPHPAPMAAKAPPLEELSATKAIKSVAPTPAAFQARAASVTGRLDRFFKLALSFCVLPPLAFNQATA